MISPSRRIWRKPLVVVVLVISLWVAGVASGAIINDRPVTPAPAGSALQDLLDSVTVSGGISVDDDQTPFAVFTNDASGAAVASFVIELAAGGGGSFGSGVNEFGIYKFGSPDVKAAVFQGDEGAGDRAMISFRDDGDVVVMVIPGDGSAPEVRATSGFGSVFGFYMDVYDSVLESPSPSTGTLDYTVFSEDDLNTGAGNSVAGAGALLYQGDNATVLEVPGFAAGTFTDDEFIVAFEDGNSYQKDFADLVVLVESITPIPEPASILVWSLLLGVIGITVSWRRNARAK